MSSAQQRYASLSGLIQSDAWGYVDGKLSDRRAASIKRMISKGADPLERAEAAAEIREIDALRQLPRQLLDATAKEIPKEGDVH